MAASVRFETPYKIYFLYGVGSVKFLSKNISYVRIEMRLIPVRSKVP